ncbi:MAG: glycosyltransferase family 4 protein, partial [Acidimicrobiales bacterium]
VVNTLRSMTSAERYSGARKRSSSVRSPLAKARYLLEDALEKRAVQRVVAISQEVAREWRSHPASRRVAGGQVDVIYSGVDLETYRPTSPRTATREELAIPDTAPILLNVARLDKGKGQQYLVPMMAAVLTSFPSARLLIAGEGNERLALAHAFQDAGLSPSVHLLGQRVDVPTLLAEADVFVFPSLSEGLGNAVIEAIAAGLPVVAFRIPALNEMVEDGVNGYLVDVGNPTALAEAVISVLGRTDGAAPMRAHSRRIASERFDVNQWAARLAAIYVAVAGGESRSLGGRFAPRASSGPRPGLRIKLRRTRGP